MEIASSVHSPRYSILLPYCLGLTDPSSNRKNLEAARTLFDSVTPQETMVLVDSVMQAVDDIDLVKVIVTRMLHSFTKSLTAQYRPFEGGFPFIDRLTQRNDSIQQALESLKPFVTRLNKGSFDASEREKVLAILQQLNELTDQYAMKENLLFPVVERFIEESRCVQLMWAIHDDIRLTLKRLSQSIGDESVDMVDLNRLFGQLFFDMKSMIFREEQVLLPTVLPRIPRNELIALTEEQHEQGQVDASIASASAEQIDLITGNPSAKQLVQIFNHLPVDITLVDADDRVVYFNTPEHRIFPRTKAVIGRTVQNCHPPKSMHMVQRILDSFRAKKQNMAEFRITVGGRYVRISYRAIYDTDGSYAGTLEVSQDITDLKELEGEKRLLDWGGPSL